MAPRPPDPYKTLGVSPSAPDGDVRAAYRRLVQVHHPDHNGGSPESARRFEEIQEAYAEIRRRRGSGAATPPPRARASAPPRPRSSPGAAAGPGRPDPRLAEMEREIREANLARERARQAARDAAATASAGTGPKRPSDEELGYITTDDSLGKILADAGAQLAERFTEAKEPVANRVAHLLDELAAKLGDDKPPRDRD
jgi:curved DNA-binding protein CbpA